MIRYYLGVFKHYRHDPNGFAYVAAADATLWNPCSLNEFKAAIQDVSKADMMLGVPMPPRCLWDSFWEHQRRMV